MEKEKERPKLPEKKENASIKPKEKKLVYKLAESSSSDSSEEEDEVVSVKKIKNKKEHKKQIYHQPENRETLDSTLYKSSQELLHKRAIEERVRANLARWNTAMMPQEY